MTLTHSRPFGSQIQIFLQQEAVLRETFTPPSSLIGSKSYQNADTNQLKRISNIIHAFSYFLSI
jgi:hypothetical protein